MGSSVCVCVSDRKRERVRREKGKGKEEGGEREEKKMIEEKGRERNFIRNTTFFIFFHKNSM